MARPAKRPNNTDFVDINSNTQVVKVYRKKGRVVRILSVVFAVIYIVVGSGMIYYYNVLDSLNFESTEYASSTQNATGDTGMDTNINDMVGDGDLLSDPKVLNIMLFGEDYHSADSYGRSDSMIMATINNRSKTIKLTSFQRDTYVNIPDYGYNKITHAFSYGGPALAIKTVEANFGIKIDRYAVVDFKSFKRIVDILGGVTLDITAEEAGYINLQVRINNQSDKTTVLDVVDGEVTLDGVQSLWYARNRGFQEEGISEVYAGDDWDRTDRQRKFLNAVFEELKTASLPEIIEIVAEVGPLVTTNLKKDEITGLVANALTYLKYDFESYGIPQDGYWQYDYNEAGSVIVITDMNACRTDFANFVFDGMEEESETETETEIETE